MPHEVQVRAWLRRARVIAEEADDVVQEAYCRLAMLDDVDHIEQPGAYFFSIVRNLLVRRRRGENVVSLESIAVIETLPDPNISPELEVAARLDAERIRGFIGQLPDRCRRIVEMRKLEGYSQAEIARLLGITESVVENNVYRGVKAVVKRWQLKNEEVSDRLKLFEAEVKERS
ncbi:sigma-70 family RNA polymerase sigma factor [Sphingobium sp. AR-3-1]|uniref:Sigma-70 family RNA polymerase sigma factor n=1 Tax=Sphingobium psychrophilum TaxID=2728834 RepID=A0A7X9X095_9SPHN|nr:sigma-70 family RNA polymerase sigma factor [Sphingobium psychrophilum]NML13201.1 sigma-70 family RNA polymerase sigma factor [Sphingobium psychrophilum]